MLELFAVRGQLAITLGVHATVAAAAWSGSLLAADARHRGEEGDHWNARATLAARTAVATGALVLVQLPVFWSEAVGTAGLGVFGPLVLAFGLVVARAMVLQRRPDGTGAVWASVLGSASGIIGLLVAGWLSTPHLLVQAADGGVTVSLGAIWSNPSGWMRVVHVGSAALAVGGAIYAAGAARRKQLTAQSRALVFVGVALLAQPLMAVLSFRDMGRHEPVKAAAVAAHWETASSADLQLGAWPYDFGEASRPGIVIDGMLSTILHGDSGAEVIGLLAFPMEGRPPVAALHLGYQAMILMFGLALVLVGVVMVRSRRGKVSRWLLGAGLVPMTLSAWFLGWMVNELGRQPWTIRNVLRVGDATWLPRGLAPAACIVLVLLSLVLSGRLVWQSRRLGRRA